MKNRILAMFMAAAVVGTTCLLYTSIAALVGGGGGGRPNMAQAGGKNPAGIPDAIAKVEEVLGEQIR